MIRSLSETLKALLNDAKISSGGTLVEIIFDRPTEPFKHDFPIIDLFLYDIRENVELRTNEPVIERENGQVVIHRPPIRLVCSYVVTAWPYDGAELTLQEHRLLSKVLQALARYPTIPEKYLKLSGFVGQDPSLPMLTAQADGLQNPAEFWTAIGNKLRPSLTVKVTISVPVFEDITGPMVTTKTVGYGVGSETIEESFVQIAGRVRTAAGEGIPNAQVDILDAGLRTITEKTEGREGFYSFRRVPVGTHEIRVVAVGYQPKDHHPLEVPSRPEDYEIFITPL